jgi:hypothetical protein
MEPANRALFFALDRHAAGPGGQTLLVAADGWLAAGGSLERLVEEATTGALARSGPQLAGGSRRPGGRGPAGASVPLPIGVEPSGGGLLSGGRRRTTRRPGGGCGRPPGGRRQLRRRARGGVAGGAVAGRNAEVAGPGPGAAPGPRVALGLRQGRAAGRAVDERTADEDLEFVSFGGVEGATLPVAVGRGGGGRGP